VRHDIIQEGDVVKKLRTSMQSGKGICDGSYSVPTVNPGLDTGDHHPQLYHGARWQGVSTARPAIRQPVLVPRRLAPRKDLQASSRPNCGYELGVPQNWSRMKTSYFFTNDVKNWTARSL
jgi:hypothetical protein